MLLFIHPHSYNPLFEERINKFINHNNLPDQSADPIFPIVNGLINSDNEKDYRKSFNEMIKYNSECIQIIQDFFTEKETIQLLENTQIKRFQAFFSRSLDSFTVPINKFLEDTNKIPNSIYNMIKIIARLSSHKGDPSEEAIRLLTPGTIFHNDIPKQWKLSETNKEKFKEFISNNEFLQHFDIFDPKKEKSTGGFYKYEVENHYSLCFQGLFTYIKQYYKNDFNTLIGYDKSEFTTEYSNIFNRFNFLFLIRKIINYIEELKDEDSQISTNANLLFTSLQEQDSLELIDSIRLCTQLLFDLLNNLMESHLDPDWIYQSSGIVTGKISRQKEREKQNVIDLLENKTQDRAVTMELEKCGVNSFYKVSNKTNLDYLESKERIDHRIDERVDRNKELYSMDEHELEARESQGMELISNTLPPIEDQDQKEIDEGYTQKDTDREDEGLDDADEDGDYHTN